MQMRGKKVEYVDVEIISFGEFRASSMPVNQIFLV